MKRFLFIFGAMTSLTSLSAMAYVPSADYVAKQWATQTRKVKTIHVRMQTTLFDPSLPGGSAAIQEEIWIKRPSYFRRASQYPRGELNSVVGPSRATRVSLGNAQAATMNDALGPLGLFYFFSDGGRMISAMEQSGASQLSRWTLLGSEPTYEVGAKDGNRFWMAKPNWTPAGGVWEGKQYKFQPATAGRFPIPFPISVEVSAGDRLVEKWDVTSVETDVSIPDHLFDINRLQGASPKK